MKKNMFSIIGLSLFMIVQTSCWENEFGTVDLTMPEDEETEIHYPESFTHPGVLHNEASIERMREIVAEAKVDEPAYKTYLAMAEDDWAKSDYTIQGPFEYIARQGEYGSTKDKYEADFGAVYLNTLMWLVTQDEAHAEKAVDILTQYADKLIAIPEHNDARLLAGLITFRTAFALDMLKSTYPDMKQEDVDKINGMIRNVFLPWLEKFYAGDPDTNGNWGLIVSRGYMALAILWDDMDMYKEVIDFLLHGNDNGTFLNYIDRETGQCQESGRDQGHVQLGIGAACSICEMAYKQGTDLYAVYDNLVMKGYEYTAKYNAGYDDVPFKTWKDVTGKYSNWTEISSEDRGEYRSIYGIAYNHYVLRKGLSMPYTKEILERNGWLGQREEGIDYDVFQFNDKNLY